MGALVPCVDCGQPISKRAPVCLSCGREIRPTPWGLMWGGIRGFGRVMLAFFVIWALVGTGLLLSMSLGGALGLKP